MAQTVKNLPAMQETQVLSLDQEEPPEKGMETHSSIFAWPNYWTTREVFPPQLFQLPWWLSW